MSGQRNKKPDDIVMKRQEYLDNLNLQIELQDANERAVRTYKETGQMPVSTQMKDNRTVEDKLRDVEKIKASIREDMAVIADSRLTESIIQLIQNSPFNQDGNLLIFFAQRAPDIVKNLQKSYKFGIRGDQNDAEQFVSFVIKFYTDKNNLNSSTKQFMSRLGTTSKQGLSRKINEQAEILTRLEVEMKRIVLHVKNSLPATYNRISLLPFKQNIVSKSEYLTQMIEAIKEIYPPSLIYYVKGDPTNKLGLKSTLQDIEKLFTELQIDFLPKTRAIQNDLDLFLNYINKNIPNLDYVNTLITKLQRQSDILIKRPDDINKTSFIDALDNLESVINTGEDERFIKRVIEAKDNILDYIRMKIITHDFERTNIGMYGSTDFDLSATTEEEEPVSMEGEPLATAGVPITTAGVPVAPETSGAAEGSTAVSPVIYLENGDPVFNIKGLKDIKLKDKNEYMKKYSIFLNTVYFYLLDDGIDERVINGIINELNADNVHFTNINSVLSILPNITTPEAHIMKDMINSYFVKSKVAELNRRKANPPLKRRNDIPPTTTPIIDKDAEVERLVVLLQRTIPLDLFGEINDTVKRITEVGVTRRKTEDEIMDEIIQYLNNMVKETKPKPAGSGLRKTSKIQGTGFPQPVYNFTKQKVEPTQGIQSDPRYIKFGRYLVNTKSLKDNKLSLRREKGTPIASLPVYKMSHPFGNVMKKIVGGALPTAEDFSQLTDDEKRYLHKVSKEADLSHKMEIPTPSKDEEEKDVHLFNVYKGEIMAGNDSKEMIKKFKLLMIKLVNNRSLDKRDVSEIMQMLTEAGY